MEKACQDAGNLSDNSPMWWIFTFKKVGNQAYLFYELVFQPQMCIQGYNDGVGSGSCSFKENPVDVQGGACASGSAGHS